MKMRRAFCGLPVLLLLSACADPLRDVPRLSDVELSPQDPVALALPSEEEIAREGILNNTLEQTGPLAGTSAPKTPQRRGILGILDRLAPAEQTASPSQAAVAPSEQTSSELDSDKAENIESAAIPTERTAAGGGLFSRLLQGGAPASGQLAEADGSNVSYGTVLPFGTVGRVCDARGKSLGQSIERASASGHRLYDSAPGATGLRTFYITGFSDGCPRQLTAAHVLLGAPSFYELLHYGPAGAHLPVGETDKAYEKVKRDVCGVRKGKPCGSKMRALERSTFFVNAYERVDDNTHWSELLVHQGRVVATAMKTN